MRLLASSNKNALWIRSGLTADVPRHRWRQFVDDCNDFVNSPEAERAAQLGWHTMNLFGCRPNYPLSYLGEAGLLWHVSGGKVIEVRRDCAVIERSVNKSQSTFSRRDVAKQRVVLPWTLSLARTARPQGRFE